MTDEEIKENADGKEKDKKLGFAPPEMGQEQGGFPPEQTNPTGEATPVEEPTEQTQEVAPEKNGRDRLKRLINAKRGQ